MISRVAEHCFWMGRYLERAEDTARVLEVNRTTLLDYDVPVENQWKPLLIISGIHNFPAAADAEAVQNHLTWDTQNHSSIVSSLLAARENARIIREVISAEMWERLNFYHLWMQSPAAHTLYERSRSDFYNRIKRINQLVHGIAEGTMAHGEAWDFFLLGKYLERACQTARILDVKYHVLLPTPAMIGTPVDNAHWVAILTSCSAYEAYHKLRNQAEAGVAVAGFLILDALFPRSVRHCLRQCQGFVHAVSGRPLSRPENDVEFRLNALLGWLQLVTIDDLVRTGLHEALTRVVDQIHEIGAAIHQTYFDFRLPAPNQSPEMAKATA